MQLLYVRSRRYMCSLIFWNEKKRDQILLNSSPISLQCNFLDSMLYDYSQMLGEALFCLGYPIKSFLEFFFACFNAYLVDNKRLELTTTDEKCIFCLLRKCNAKPKWREYSFSRKLYYRCVAERFFLLLLSSDIEERNSTSSIKTHFTHTRKKNCTSLFFPFWLALKVYQIILVH